MLKKIAKKVYRAVKGTPESYKGEIYKRITHRHTTFWDNAEAETVRNTIMYADDPLAKWQNVPHWQRKLSNKHNSREFAKMQGCRVAELYWRGRDLRTLDMAQLPEQYVIRPTIGFSSNLVYVMNGSYNLMDQKQYTKEQIQTQLQAALQKNPDLEFLVEEFLRTESGEYKLPLDYKFYMAGEHVACIFVVDRLSPKTGYSTYYDESWNQLGNLNTGYPEGPYLKPPACLPEMLAQAKKLSKIYGIFVRIDFYATDKGVVFGEFTPTPFKGNGFTPEGDKLLTEYWDKYCPGKI